ncbi:MAG: hypothetical protein RIQ93_436 [Verrucomicrobiota bacterium]|jgi:GNAT superfamily N-acetyltransferase
MTAGPIAIEAATLADAPMITELRLGAARDLTTRFGSGTWSFAAESEFGVRNDITYSLVLVARDEGRVLGSLKLSTQSPYLRQIAGFTPVDRPIYLTAMAVTPRRQRQGIGRRLLEEARLAAVELCGQAIRLDSYDSPSGAAEFYQKAGFREVARGDYNGTPLVWFETMLGAE